MSQTLSSEVVLKNIEDAVIVPLKDGISSLSRVYQALVDADIDPVSGKCFNYDYIRTQIVQVQQNMEQSEQAASTELRFLDKRLESLIKDEAKHELDMAVTKCLGMLIGGGIEGQALDAIKMAKEEVKKCEDLIKKYRSKVSDYEIKIFQTKQSIVQKNDKLEKIYKDIQQMKKQKEVLAEFQYKVRRAVHLLGVLSARTSVAERQTRRFILQEPVIRVIEEVISVTKEITEIEFLNIAI
ncbi:uncharacterized protein si:dkey-85k15.6 [Trichomycterus rosablanca]|uniref:uncharacterized protein si:dkey-85k15.6 n=1 Tax=Trichomycterus rosablanca TaxID=2290929 RepID=UPI002F3587B7